MAELSSLHFSLTARCNLKCAHCGAAGPNQSLAPTSPELTTAEYLSLIDQAAALGCRQLTIAGGEPLLRNDLWTILEHAGNHHIACALLTNGVLIDKAAADRLSRLPNLNYVRLSVDYADNESMRAFRGLPNLTDRIFAALQTLSEAGVTAGINTTMMPDNLEHILPLALRTRACGGRFFRAVPLLPAGRAENRVVNVDFWAKAIRIMLNVQLALGLRTTKLIWLPEDLADAANRFLLECPAGIRVLAVSATGGISGCSMIPAPAGRPTTRDLPLRELHELTKQEQIERTKAAYADRTSGCGACRYATACRGGCHAERAARGVTARSPQPICLCEAWFAAMEGMKQDQSLRQVVGRVLSTIAGQKLMGYPPCHRGLPIWTCPL